MRGLVSWGAHYRERGGKVVRHTEVVFLAGVQEADADFQELGCATSPSTVPCEQCAERTIVDVARDTWFVSIPDRNIELWRAQALADPPFTRFVAEHRPLGGVLWRFVDGIVQGIRDSPTLEDLDLRAGAAEEAIAAIRPRTPTLGAGGAGSVVEKEYWGARQSDGGKPSVTRHWFRREIIGDPALLSFWPAANGIAFVDRDEPHEYLLAHEAMWTVGKVGGTAEEEGTWALYTPFDLTGAEQQAVRDGQIDLQAVYDGREQLILPIIEAIGAEVTSFFEESVPQILADAVESRRERLQAIVSVTHSIGFAKSWKLAVPQLDDADPVAAGSPSPREGVEVAIPVFRDRLAEASFEDLQRSIRVWANAIERYPKTFTVLSEDQISDLLAATLHAALPGADREVFSKHGKTDIQVRAKALDDGLSDARVFIAETKFATSTKIVREALDPQLFGYLNTSHTAAVLLLLFRQKNFARALNTHLPYLKKIEGFVGESSSVANPWNIYRYRRDGKDLRLLIATVHIPA